jgi:AAA domain/RepB DNA-primase from phage plasmid
MTPPAMEAEEFLEIVWGKRRGWIDLPAKVGGYWVPFHYRWEGEATHTVTRRIDSCLRDSESLYFSVGMFKKRGRNEDDFIPTYWLWADLDDVHPSRAGEAGFLPTIAWRSSRERYQALWRLDQTLRPEVLAKLNRALSYFLGADRSGWDLTQVLRVPGTRNFKYPEAPVVELLWHHPDMVHDPRKIWKRVRGSAPRDDGGNHPAVRDGRPRSIPARARSLLRVPPGSVVEGERSSRLWELECLLAEAGWNEAAILTAVSESAWNKWRDRRDRGEKYLKREIRKAIRHVNLQNGRRERAPKESSVSKVSGEANPSTDLVLVDTKPRPVQQVDLTEEGPSKSPFIRYSSFMAMEMEAPRWMIEGMWTQSSHGILGGEPKTGKTTIALAMAMAIASGREFLGVYPVHVQGPVLVIQEENAPWVMQDRMRKIARRYGLVRSPEYTVEKAPRGSTARKAVSLEFPSEVPLRILNNYGFNLALEEHRELLETEVQRVRPVAIFLDPLYMVLGGVNTDKAEYIYPFLRWLMDLRYEYDVAPILIHHMSKRTEIHASRRPGQNLMGSATFHGWVDAALYTELLEEGDKYVRVKIEKEFRSQPPQKAVEMELRMGNPGDLQFSAQIRGWDLSGLIEALVAREPGITAIAASDQLSVDKRTLLKIARGSERVIVQSGKRGRGHTHKLFIENGKKEKEKEE